MNGRFDFRLGEFGIFRVINGKFGRFDVHERSGTYANGKFASDYVHALVVFDGRFYFDRAFRFAVKFTVSHFRDTRVFGGYGEIVSRAVSVVLFVEHDVESEIGFVFDIRDVAIGSETEFRSVVVHADGERFFALFARRRDRGLTFALGDKAVADYADDRGIGGRNRDPLRSAFDGQKIEFFVPAECDTAGFILLGVRKVGVSALVAARRYRKRDTHAKNDKYERFCKLFHLFSS